MSLIKIENEKPKVITITTTTTTKQVRTISKTRIENPQSSTELKQQQQSFNVHLIKAKL